MNDIISSKLPILETLFKRDIVKETPYVESIFHSKSTRLYCRPGNLINSCILAFQMAIILRTRVLFALIEKHVRRWFAFSCVINGIAMNVMMLNCLTLRSEKRSVWLLIATFLTVALAFIFWISCLYTSCYM